VVGTHGSPSSLKSAAPGPNHAPLGNSSSGTKRELSTKNGFSGNYTATVRFDGVLFRKAHLSLPTLADDPERVAYETGSRCFPCPTIAPINQPFVA
jgi:hypothetical protein